MDRVLIKKLPLLLPIMMALTSCSTMNTTQTVHAAKHGQRVQTTKSSASLKHKYVKPVAHHYQQSSLSPSSSSSHQPQTQYHAKPVSGQGVMPIEKPVVEQYKPVAPVNAQYVPVTSNAIPNPVVVDIWLLNVHGLDLTPRNYKKLDGASVVPNLRRKDLMTGEYHYVQVSRWDGQHIDHGYVNARMAAMLSLLENGYIETNFGTTLMIFGGSGYVVDVPGHKYHLMNRPAKVKSESVKAKSELKSNKKSNNTLKKKYFKKHFKKVEAKFDGSDFYISGTRIITVKSKNIHADSKVTVDKAMSKKALAEQAKKQPSSTISTFSKDFCGLEKVGGVQANIPGTAAHNIWEANLNGAAIGQQMAANEAGGGAASNYSTPVYTDGPR